MGFVRFSFSFAFQIQPKNLHFNTTIQISKWFSNILSHFVVFYSITFLSLSFVLSGVALWSFSMNKKNTKKNQSKCPNFGSSIFTWFFLFFTRIQWNEKNGIRLIFVVVVVQVIFFSVFHTKKKKNVTSLHLPMLMRFIFTFDLIFFLYTTKRKTTCVRWLNGWMVFCFLFSCTKTSW